MTNLNNTKSKKPYIKENKDGTFEVKDGTDVTIMEVYDEYVKQMNGVINNPILKKLIKNFDK